LIDGIVIRFIIAFESSVYVNDFYYQYSGRFFLRPRESPRPVAGNGSHVFVISDPHGSYAQYMLMIGVAGESKMEEEESAVVQASRSLQTRGRTSTNHGPADSCLSPPAQPELGLKAAQYAQHN
jgi:hypothetical protein